MGSDISGACGQLRRSVKRGVMKVVEKTDIGRIKIKSRFNFLLSR